MVHDDLATGRLVKLDMPDNRSAILSVAAIYRADNPPGPAASWLIARFEEQCRTTMPASGSASKARTRKARI
jgi:DNA-binding transcriptional LysR family regulator